MVLYMLNNELFIKIGKDLSRIQKGGGIDTQWPFVLPDFEISFGEDIINHLNFVLCKFLNTHTIDDAANLLKCPSKVSQYILLIHSAKHLNKKDRKKLILTLTSILKKLRKNYLCENGTNQLNNFDYKNYLNHTQFTKEDTKKINQLSSTLYAYLEKLYPTMMRLGFEYHGPYIYNNKKYIFKEYFDLNNNYIPNCKIDYKNIKIVYEIDNDVYVDFFGHIYGDGKTKVVGLYIDGNKISDITEVFNKIKDIYEYQKSLFLNYNYKDYAKNLVFGIFFSLKPICDKIGVDWKPRKNVIEKTKNFKLIFPLENVLNKIHQTPTEDLERKITKSFSEIFDDK